MMNAEEAEENIDEGCVHGDDVRARSRENGVTGFCHGTFVFVCACGVVRYVGDDRRNGCIGGVGICLGSEEGVDAARAGTEKEVHCDWRWREVVCTQRHMWKISAMSVSKLGMPSIGVGPSGKALFMSARDVGVAEDMVSRIMGKF